MAKETRIVNLPASQKGLAGYYFHHGINLAVCAVSLLVLYWGLYALIGTIKCPDFSKMKKVDYRHAQYYDGHDYYDQLHIKKANSLKELWRYGIDGKAPNSGPEYLVIPLVTFIGMGFAGYGVASKSKCLLNGIQLSRTVVVVDLINGIFWRFTYGWFGKKYRRRIEFDCIPNTNLSQDSCFDAVNYTGTIYLTLRTYAKAGFKDTEVSVPYVEKALARVQEIEQWAKKREIDIGVDIKSVSMAKEQSMKESEEKA